MELGELVRIYKQHGDLPLYFRDFDGNLVEAGCHYIHAFGVGFYKMIIPCDEMETVMRLGTGKKVTRQKAQPGTLEHVVMFKDGLASDECDIPVYVKYFDAFDINPHSERCEVVDGKLVFFHDKEIWDAWLVEKERRDKERQEQLKNMDLGKCEPRLPIIRNSEPTLLADKLVGVKPIEGPIPWWNSRDFDGKVKTLTVKRKSNGFYIYVVVEQECTQTEWTKSGEIVGFDFSLHDFLVSSNGDDCSMPKLLRKNLNSLRNLSEKYRKSKGKRGSLRTLQKLHEKVANQRSDMHWKLARKFCRDYDVMVFETLDLANMSKKYKKSMYDFGFNTFLGILECVAHKTGKTIMYADKWYPSSQLCSECGYQNHDLKDVSIRHWICPSCGAKHDRDMNAARNLCKVGTSTFGTCCPPVATPRIPQLQSLEYVKNKIIKTITL